MLRAALRKSGSLLRQEAFVQLWWLPSWLLLGMAKAAISTIAFKRLAPCLGAQQDAAAWVPLADASCEARALQIGRAVRLAARYTPWDSSCFPQALVARLLLGLYGIPYGLYFGLMHDRQSGALTAHAWVAVGKVSVTGGAGFGRFAVVGAFVAPRLLRA